MPISRRKQSGRGGKRGSRGNRGGRRREKRKQIWKRRMMRSHVV
jgi:hypothetical protein